MKNTFQFIFLLAILSLASVRAEETSALRWRFELTPVAGANDTAELILIADIDSHSLVYSSDFKSDIGPQPTAIDFSKSEGIEPVGPVVSVEPKRKKDKTWDIELGYFETRAEFRQKVKILRKDYTVRGTIAGQLCNEAEGTCTLFTQPFEMTAVTTGIKK
jgi:Disulphide bond corrector protein DsbC